MKKVILDLKDRRPVWAMPPWVAEEIEAALPAGWELHVMETEADGSGDGLVNLDPALLEAARDAEIYLGYGVPAALLREGKELRWVHSGAAGVRGSLTPEMMASPVLFTNSKGIHGPPMADTALGMILHFARGLDLAVAAQARGAWDKDAFYSGRIPLLELAHSTVGVFGFGGIGREVARRALLLGSRVLAFDRGPEVFEAPGARFQEGAEYTRGRGDRRGAAERGVPTREPTGSRERPGATPDLPGKPGGPGPGSGVDPLHGDAGFRLLLAESDFLVLTAPETAETRGRFDAGALAAMKPQATLINISRGRLVDEEALVEALRGGRLRGAGLDVFGREPLPEDHPFWTLPNVLLTPHVSGVTAHFWRRQTDLVLENLRRYLAGETLLNLVDREAGF
jgi:phosphoglycerate dehydrogenase-like enzyme